jgi:hypothetical protein
MSKALNFFGNNECRKIFKGDFLQKNECNDELLCNSTLIITVHVGTSCLMYNSMMNGIKIRIMPFFCAYCPSPSCYLSLTLRWEMRAKTLWDVASLHGGSVTQRKLSLETMSLDWFKNKG